MPASFVVSSGPGVSVFQAATSAVLTEWPPITATYTYSNGTTSQERNLVLTGEGITNRESLVSVSFTNSLTGIGPNAFAGCEQLSNLTLPNTVTQIGNLAFAGCRNLSQIDFGSSLVSLGEYVFVDCYSLENINLPASLTTLSGLTFFQNRVLRNINVSSANPDYSSTNGILYNKNGSELICLPAGKGFPGPSLQISNTVSKVRENAISYLDSIYELIIPSSVTVFEANFELCYALQKLRIQGCELATTTMEFQNNPWPVPFEFIFSCQSPPLGFNPNLSNLYPNVYQPNAQIVFKVPSPGTSWGNLWIDGITPIVRYT